MGRPKGLPKTGGRLRGTPNRKTEAVIEKLSELGCDPILGLAKIADDPNTALELRVKCYGELAQYIHPKRKAITAMVDVGVREKSADERLRELLDLKG